MREEWVDNIKGMAILLVVIGHVIDGFELNGIYGSAKYAWNTIDLIYSFHMPLFFMISGYLYRKVYLSDEYQIKDTNKYKLHVINLVYIYLLFSIIKVLLKIFWPYDFIKTVTGKDLILILIKPIVPYWYLWVIICLYLFMPFCIAKIKMVYLATFLFVISLLCYLLLPKAISEYGFAYAAMYGFFFAMGILKKRTEHLNIYRFLLESVIFVLCAGCAFSRYIFLPSILSKIAKIVCAIVCSDYIVNVFCTFFGKSGGFGVLGKHSLEIFTIHMFITRPIGSVLKLLHIKTYFGGAIVATILGIFLPVVFGVVSKKVRLYKNRTLYDMVYCPFKHILWLEFFNQRGKVKIIFNEKHD